MFAAAASAVPWPFGIAGASAGGTGDCDGLSGSLDQLLARRCDGTVTDPFFEVVRDVSGFFPGQMSKVDLGVRSVREACRGWIIGSKESRSAEVGGAR